MTKFVAYFVCFGIFSDSVPTIINNEGAKEIVELHLTSEENEKFKNSCQLLKNKCKEFLQ